MMSLLAYSGGQGAEVSNTVDMQTSLISICIVHHPLEISFPSVFSSTFTIHLQNILPKTWKVLNETLIWTLWWLLFTELVQFPSSFNWQQISKAIVAQLGQDNWTISPDTTPLCLSWSKIRILSQCTNAQVREGATLSSKSNFLLVVLLVISDTVLWWSTGEAIGSPLQLKLHHAQGNITSMCKPPLPRASFQIAFVIIYAAEMSLPECIFSSLY